MRGLEKEFSGRIDFKFVNILNHENIEIMDEFGFGTTPELYLLDANQQIIGFWDEEISADELRLVFEEALGE